MKNLLLFVFLGLFCLTISLGNHQLGHAQTNSVSCDNWPAGYTPTYLTWDWRNADGANWLAYVSTPEAPFFAELALASPFESFGNNSGNVNIQYLFLGVQQKDYLPEDGWELVYKQFGENAQNKAIDNPSFLLYNRYSGLLRVFVFLRKADVGLLQTATTSLKFITDTGTLEKESGLLSHTNGPVTNALQKFDTLITSQIINDYSNPQVGQWIVGDFPMAYDPCTCEKDYLGLDNITALQVGGQYLTETNIKLIGKETSSSTQIASGSTSQQTGFQTLFQGLLGAIAKGNTIEKSTSGLLGKYASYLEKNSPKVKPSGVSSPATKGKFETDLLKGKGKKDSTKTFDFPDLMRSLPYAGYAFYFLDFYLNGGRTSAAKKSAVTPVTVRNLEIQGTLKTSGGYQGASFYTPGTPNAQLPDNYVKPVYNHTLGVFNLLDVPVVEYVEYQKQDDSNAQNIYEGTIGVSVTGQTGVCSPPRLLFPPFIRQYRLRDPLKFAINPAANLKLLDLQVSLVYKTNKNTGNIAVPVSGHGIAEGDNTIRNNQIDNANQLDRRTALYGPVVTIPVDYSKNYVERLEQSGIHVEAWPRRNPTDTDGIDDINKITFSTGYFPAGCYDKQSFVLANYPQWVYEAPEASIIGSIDSTEAWKQRNNKKIFHFNPEITLRVKAIMRRTDLAPGQTAEDVVFIATYRVDTVSSALNQGTNTFDFVIHNPSDCLDGCAGATTCYNNLTNQNGITYMKNYYVNNFKSSSNPNGPAFPTGLTGFPRNVVLSNIHISNDTTVYAVETLTVGPNVSIEPGKNVYLLAGTRVVVPT
jgi:hypothetical protein